MLKLGIVGAGRLGGFHAEKAANHGGIKLVAVTDPSETARNALAQKHNIYSCPTLEELIPLADAAVIASPTIHHYELGESCLQHGLHVLMEKPICDSWDKAQKLVENAKRANVVFQVGHVEAFNPAWIAAQNSLHEVKAGFPVMIDAVRTSGYTFRSTDIGTVFDMMIHDIDLVLSIVPSPVCLVNAIGFNVIGGPHEDIADAWVQFENKTVAHFHSSRVELRAVREMRITTPTSSTFVDFGTRTATCSRPDKLVLNRFFAPNHVVPQRAAALTPNFMKEHFTQTENVNDAVDALAMEMDDFVESIQTGRQPRVSGNRAADAIAVAEQITKIIKKQTTPLSDFLQRETR
jgi:predicted dehydrogenase